MAPAHSNDSRTLTEDQVKLLREVTSAAPPLKTHEWVPIANKLGISNGKAAKERWRYLLNSLSGTSTKSKRPLRPKKTAVSNAATSISAARKRKSTDSDQSMADVTTSKKGRLMPTNQVFEDEKEEEGEDEVEPGGVQLKPDRPNNPPLTTESAPVISQLGAGLGTDFSNAHRLPANQPLETDTFEHGFTELQMPVTEADFSYFEDAID